MKSRMINMERIVQWLESLKIEDFMFIIDMRNMDEINKNKLNAVEVLNEMNACKSIRIGIEYYDKNVQT